MEKYIGVKFEFLDDGSKIDENELKKFLNIDKALGMVLKTRKNEGNLSIRTKNGFLMKRTGTQMTKLKQRDVVFVRKVVGSRVFCSGGMPSSESLMHYNTYKSVHSAMIILHFHHDELLGKLQFKRVGPFPYGSVALAECIGNAAKTDRIIEIIGHGFVIVAKTQDELFALLKVIERGARNGS